MISQVSIQNLMVVDFPSEVLTQQLRDWRIEKGIPYAMSCSRNLWYGAKSDFEDFPFSELNGRVRSFQQDEAYSQLMRAIVGEYILQVKRGLKINTNGQAIGYRQFYEGFDLLQRDNPKSADRYQEFYNQISEDIDFVRDTYADQFKRLSFDRAALELAGYQKGHYVLIVGHKLPAGNLSTNTKALISIAEEMNLVSEGGITVTHPDDETLVSIQQSCERLKASGELKGSIRFGSFSDLPQLVERADHMFICIPTGSHVDVEMEMAEIWKGRIRQDNTLTTIQRDKENLNASYDIWDNEGLDHYFSPEHIDLEVKRVVGENNQLLKKIDAVYASCGRLRLEGHNPRDILLQGDSPDLTLS